MMLAATAVAFLLAPTMAYAQVAPRAGRVFESGQQPLGDALQRFGQASGFDIVFPEEMVRGRVAGPVGRTSDPHQALQQMLAGTGLEAVFSRPDAVLLRRRQHLANPDMTLDPLTARGAAARTLAASYQWYGQRLLEASLGRLRAVAALIDQPYDLSVYLWVDGHGRVTATRVYGAPGAEPIVTIAEQELRALALRAPPPANMPQPVGLRIASH